MMHSAKPGLDLAAISRQIAEGNTQGGPPLDKWNPEFCGDIDLKIKRDGSWWYNGTPIGRQAMVKLFSTVLWKEENQYFLKTPVEKIGIQVEDVPFLFVHLEVVESDGQSSLVFVSQTEDKVIAGPEHPIRVDIDSLTHEPSPYISVRYGMEGLISRAVFYDLVEMAETEVVEGREQLVVKSGGTRFVLGTLD